MSCEITYGNSKNKGCLIPGKSTYMPHRFSGRNNKQINNDGARFLNVLKLLN